MFSHFATPAGGLPLGRVRRPPDPGPETEAGRGVPAGEPRAVAGRIEHCARDFVCGWIEDGDATHVDVSVNAAHTEAHTLFSDGAQVDSASVARRRYFVVCLAASLQVGDSVAVRLDARDLVGSPKIIAVAKPPAETERSDLRFHVETRSDAIANRLCTVSGWATLHPGARDLRLLVNGRPQNAVFTVRPDVNEHFGSPAAVGWQFTCDVAAHEAEGATALLISGEVDGQVIGERDIELRLAPLSRPRPPLHLLMHVPKTAGTSLKAAIVRRPELATHWLYHCGRFSVPAQVAALTSRAYQDVDLVGGHFMFGIHEGIERECRYTTILREPLKFLHSYFFYRKDVQRFPPFRDLDIFQAMEGRLDHLLDNCITRFFTGMPAEQPVDEAALTAAMSNMERHFEFVGVMERMEESAARLSGLLGVPLDLGLENVTPRSAEARGFDNAAISERAEPFCRYDDRLYRHALRLFWT